MKQADKQFEHGPFNSSVIASSTTKREASVAITKTSSVDTQPSAPNTSLEVATPMLQPHEVEKIWNRKQFRTPAIRRTGLPVSACGPTVVWPHGGWSGGYSGYCAALRYGHPSNCTDTNQQPTKHRLLERSASRPIWSNPNGQADPEGGAYVCPTCCHRASRCRNHKAPHLAVTAGADVWPRHPFSKLGAIQTKALST